MKGIYVKIKYLKIYGFACAAHRGKPVRNVRNKL